MKFKDLLYLVVIFNLVSDAVYAEKSEKLKNLSTSMNEKKNDVGKLLNEEFSHYEIYAAIDEKGVDVEQSCSDEVSIKDPDNQSPYVEVGLRNKY